MKRAIAAIIFSLVISAGYTAYGYYYTVEIDTPCIEGTRYLTIKKQNIEIAIAELIDLENSGQNVEELLKCR